MAGIDQYTLLLLAGDSFTDLSPLQKPVTPGSVTAGNSETHFPGATSFYFSGGTPIQVPPSDFGDGDLTIDWWEYCLENAYTRFNSWYGAGSGGILLGFLGTEIYVSSTGGAWEIFNDVTAMSVTVGEWVHWAFIRNGNIFSTYRNGQKFWEANGTGPIGDSSEYPWGIGSYFGGSEHPFRGYIQEFRVSNVARWTSDFTPPTEPYSPDIASPSIFAPSSVIAGGQFVVSWSAVADAASYTLEQQTDGGSWSQVYTGAGTNYRATAAGSSMTFRVLATDADGNESEYATSGSVKIFPNISSTRFGGVIVNG